MVTVGWLGRALLKCVGFLGLSTPWLAPLSTPLGVDFDLPGEERSEEAVAGHVARQGAGALRAFAEFTVGAYMVPMALRPFVLEFPRWQAYIRTRFDGHRGRLWRPPTPAVAPAEGGVQREADFRRALRLAAESPDPAARQAFLDGPLWAQAAAQVPQEEPLMQVIAHLLAYMHWAPGQDLPLAIETSVVDGPLSALDDGQLFHYARHNIVRDVLPRTAASPKDPAARLAAFFFTPPADHPGPAIILFRGTHLTRRDVLTRADPTGLEEDLDPQGVGFAAFAAHRAALVAWVEAAQAAGRGVVLVGHSLGATLAARLLAALTPEAQAKVRLLAFAPAGLDAAAADAIRPQAARVRVVLDADDLVPACGARLPPGVVVETRMWQQSWTLSAASLVAAHIRPTLAAAALGWSPAPWARIWAAERIDAPPLTLPEWGRAYIMGPLLRATVALARLWPEAGTPPEAKALARSAAEVPF